MSLINNTKYAILDDKGILTNKYTLTPLVGFTNARLLKIQQGLIVLPTLDMTGATMFVDNDKLIINGSTFYAQFSDNNVDGFTTAQDLLETIDAVINT